MLYLMADDFTILSIDIDKALYLEMHNRSNVSVSVIINENKWLAVNADAWLNAFYSCWNDHVTFGHKID